MTQALTITSEQKNELLKFLKKNKKPDMIILDLMLPKKNGFEVLKEIKSNNEWKNIPLVILSNLGQEEDIKKGKL